MTMSALRRTDANGILRLRYNLFVVAAILLSTCHAHNHGQSAHGASQSSANSNVLQLKPHILSHKYKTQNTSEVVIASEKDGNDHFYILSHAENQEGSKQVLVHKLDPSSMDVLWTAELSVAGIPRGFCISDRSEKTGEIDAFVVLKSSDPKTRQAQGMVVRILNVDRRASAGKQTVVYTAKSSESHAELRSCTTGKQGGSPFLYVAGGTTGKIFSDSIPAQALSEVVVAKMRYTGENVSGVQVGFPKKHSHASDVMFNTFSNPPELLVAAHFQDSVSSTSALYRFSIDDLSLRNKPSPLNSFARITPQSVSASPRFLPESNTSIIFMGGTARVAADKGNDVLCEFHSRYGNKSEALPVYLDGAETKKLNNYGAVVKGGSDGNAYIGGYSIHPLPTESASEPINIPLLFVVSPTGRKKFQHELNLPINASQNVVGMEIVDEKGSGRKVYFLGNSPRPTQSKRQMQEIMVSGVDILTGSIGDFPGFGNIVGSASTENSDKSVFDDEASPSSSKRLIPILAGVAGGLVCLVGGISLLALRKKYTADVEVVN